VSGVTPILKKELREIWRDPYTLGIAVFLPLILLFLFAYALNLDVTGIPMAVLDLDHSRESRRYVDAFTSTGRFKLESRLVSPDQMGELLDRGTVQVALLIPSGFERSLSSGGQAEVQTLIDGTFPDYARVIPVGNDKTLVVEKSEFAAAVDRVSTVSSERGRAVKLSLSEGKLTLSVTNPDSGSATEELEVEYSSDALDIGFNSRYLLDITSQIEGEKAELKLADPGSPTLLRDKESAGALYVLMPMRV